MKVLIVLETLSAGGAEIFAMNWATEANRLGYQTEIYCFHKRLNKYPTIQTNLINTKVNYSFNSVFIDKLVAKFDSLLRKLGSSRALRNWKINKDLKRLSKQDFSVIHGHLMPSDWAVSKLENVCHVTTIHGDYLRHYHTPADQRKLANFDEKLQNIMSSLSGVVCITDHQLSFFREDLKSQLPLKKIYNGFAKAKPNKPSSSKNKFTIGMVSRGIKEKGWKEACKAFIMADLPNSELILVGESVYLSELKELYKNESRINFSGYHAQPQTLIETFDVGLLPSYYGSESLPTVVIEYLNCGVPVIATRIGEVPQMLQSSKGEAGIVIDLESGVCPPEKLAKEMKFLHDNPSSLSEMGEKAKISAKKFDIEQCVESYVDFYKTLLKS